jgi:molecular chaperone DnaK (HSP70)
MYIGIDFGTCNSSAAIFDNGNIRLVKEPIHQSYSFPSTIFVKKDGELLVGYAAENSHKSDPTRYRREFKRDLGTNVPHQIGDRQFLPENLVTEIFKKIKTESETIVSSTLQKVVVTVPATYQEHKRKLMKQAVQGAGFNEVELLEEPVAAALYYAKYSSGKIQDGDIILVYDLGGGTFDTALIQKQDTGFKFLGYPKGLEHCGGIDFDRMIYEDFKTKCSPEILSLLNDQSMGLRSLQARLLTRDFCRGVKHQLSETQVAEDAFGFPPEPYIMTRETFNGMIKPILDQTLQCCESLLHEANVKTDQITRILMVGGSCRIPVVKKLLESKFHRPVFQADDPELVVCQGGALFELYQEQIKEMEAQKKQIKGERTMSDALDQIVTHLEFQGYEVERDGEIIKSRHQVKANIIMKEYSGGLLLTTFYGSSDYAKKNRNEFLAFINDLNNNARVARFYTDKDDDLIIECWYPKYYNRTDFGNLLECWNRDAQDSIVSHSNMKKFLA